MIATKEGNRHENYNHIFRAGLALFCLVPSQKALQSAGMNLVIFLGINITCREISGSYIKEKPAVGADL